MACLPGCAWYELVPCVVDAKDQSKIKVAAVPYEHNDQLWRMFDRTEWGAAVLKDCIYLLGMPLGSTKLAGDPVGDPAVASVAARKLRTVMAVARFIGKLRRRAKSNR